MNRRLLKLSLLIPLFIACQAGSEIIPPESGEEVIQDFSCEVSQASFSFDHAYDYTPGELTVAIGEERVIVDLSGAPWMEVEGNRTTIDPNSEVTFKIAPAEPNYSPAPRSGVIVLKGKYTEQSVEINVTQAGSYQDTDESLANGWRLDSNLAPSDSWRKGKLMTANKGGLKGLLTLEHSINSPVQILEDDKRGTFTGIRPGDALLLRAPVKDLAADTDVSAMICIGHKTTGEKSKWMAEYWDEGVWNEIRTFNTCNDTLDFNFSTFICDFTLKDQVVNDYVKVRFRLVSGQDDAVNFIAASPWTGAALEINAGYPAIKDTKKILILGNSFTHYWGSPFVLKQLARSQGHKLDMRVHTEPGVSLKEHSTAFTLSRDVINEGGYDFALLQENSITHAKFADKVNTTALSETNVLANAIKAESQTCWIVLENTWAYSDEDYKGYGSYDVFYDKLVAGCNEIAQSVRLEVSPIATAFKRVHDKNPEINCLYTDNHHDSRNGAYLKSCVNYLRLYGGEFNDNPYLGETTSAEFAQTLRTVAYNVVNDVPEVAPKETVTITLDFASWPLSPSLPVKGDKLTTRDTYTYTEDDVTYQFEIYAPTKGYYNTGTALRFEDQTGGYIKLPAVEGKTLVELTVAITNTSNKAIHLFSSEPVMTSTTANGDILNNKAITKQSSATFKLTGTEPGKSYYLYSKAKHTQIGKIVMTYE